MKYGQRLQIETGVEGVIRGFGKSTIYYGKAMMNLNINEGTPHLLNTETLGEKVATADGRDIKLEWALTDCLLLVEKLPQAVIDRYKLKQCDFVTVRFAN